MTPGKAPDKRKRGFEPAGSLLRAQIRAAGEARGFAVSRLLTHWAEIAGPEIAAAARPVRIGYRPVRANTDGSPAAPEGLGATLTLLVQGAMAPVVQMQLPLLRERVNACYGYNAIARIHLTQTAATGFAEPPSAFAPAPPAAAGRPSAAVQGAARAVTGGVRDDGLRAALEALAENVLSRNERTGAKHPSPEPKG